MITLQEERKVWLEYHKKKWQLQAKDRTERKRRRVEFGDVPTGTYLGGNKSGLSGFLRRTARSIMDMPWQIVQVTVKLCKIVLLSLKFY